jgi:arylsulfatase A-like enzyme
MRRFSPAVLLCLLGGGFAAIASGLKPNVLFILADDLGWVDTTLYGHTQFHRTPNLQRLAQRGMRFTRAYSASPLCSPTRSAILTGLSPARTGITTPNCHLPQVVLEATPGTAAPPDKKAIMPKPPTRLKTEYRTLAQSLKDAGYATGHFGKWRLGPEPYSPLQQGFDVDVPHHPGPGPAGSYVAPWKFKDFEHDPDVPDQHIEDRMAKEAVAFMERSTRMRRSISTTGCSASTLRSMRRRRSSRNIVRVNPADAQRSPTYAAMVESMDDAIGALLDVLDRLKLAERTIIVFTSDNGGNMYNEVDGTTPTSNRPLRGGKATVFEGGRDHPERGLLPHVARSARAEARAGAALRWHEHPAGIARSATRARGDVQLLPARAGRARLAAPRRRRAQRRLEAHPHLPRRRERRASPSAVQPAR